MDKFNLGENLQKIRQEKGISQEAMAALLNISQAKYSRIESDKPVLSHELICKAAKIFRVSEARLLPPTEAPELQTPLAIPETDNKPKPKSFLKGPIGKVIILATAYVIVNLVYTSVKGACSASGASHNTMMIVGMTSAFLTTAFIYYWIKKNKVWSLIYSISTFGFSL